MGEERSGGRNQSKRVSIEISYCSLASRCCARTAWYGEPIIHAIVYIQNPVSVIRNTMQWGGYDPKKYI